MMSVEYYPLRIVKKVQETKDAYSFYFSVPCEHESLFSYHAAQFLTFKFTIEGKEYVRSYSLSSCPFLKETLQTSVKKVEGGKVSAYMIDSLKEGQDILSQKPLGEFFRTPKTLKPQTYVLFAGGIGITPLFSILKTILHLDLCERVLLIYSNKNRDNVIYQKQIQEWQAKYKTKLNVQFVFSQTEGRLDAQKLSQFLKEIQLSSCVFYLCGPKDYMSFIKEHLQGQGASPESIYTEDFKVVPVLGPKPDKNSVFFEAGNYKEGEPQRLEARIDDQDIQISLNREKSLLEQLLDQGHNVPFSCASGSCMTCMAKLKEGKVFQLEEGILDEENIKALEMLTCQSYPLSEKVVIDYDDL